MSTVDTVHYGRETVLSTELGSGWPSIPPTRLRLKGVTTASSW